MVARSELIEAFLEKTGWAGASRTPLTGDASFRRYVRLSQSREISALLMDAPPPQENVRPFVDIANRLLSMSFSAPRILAADHKIGLLLVEDFGDATYTRLLVDGRDEAELYCLATDTLIELHRRFSDGMGIPPYDDARFLDEAALLVDWFLPSVRGCGTPSAMREEYLDLWRSAIVVARGVPETLVLRDYHVDNLIHLPDRHGIAACGLLDFQDAVIGPISYDLVSLLEDARRDVAPTVAAHCFNRYLTTYPDLEETAFRASYAVLGAQRSAKIIGIFTRLDRRDCKPVYLDHIPRVFRWLEANLRHPALSDLKNWFDLEIPDKLRTMPTASVR